MASDDSFSTNDRADFPSGSMLPVNGLALPGGPWSSPAGVTPPAGRAAPNLMDFVHALRRHWLMALGLGIVCAVVASVAVWCVYGEQYTATAVLKVAMQQIWILPGAENTWTDRDRFEIYRNTQKLQLLNTNVMRSALRDPKVAELPSIRSREGADPPGWLAQQLAVTFPDKAEFMEVSLTLSNGSEAVTLVNAVVDAYMRDVVDADPSSPAAKRARLEELQKAYFAKETEVLEKRRQLKRQAVDLGAAEQETLTLKQKLVLEELTLYRQELARVTFEARRMEGELAAQQALLANITHLEVEPAEVDPLVQSDPVARQLFTELGWRAMDQAYNSGRIVDSQGRMSPFVEHYQRDLKVIQEQFDARKAALVDVIRQRRRSQIEAEIAKLSSSVNVMKEQQGQVQAQVADREKEAAKFGNSAPDVEMLRAEIKNLDTSLAAITVEREKLKVELNNNEPRIRLQQRALLPEQPSNTMRRMLLSVFLAMVGFCVPVASVALWDTRTRRINSCADVSDGLQLPVIGSMPLIPARAIRQLESPSKRYQVWQMRLTESVDGIAARVLRKGDTEQSRVIMVSSAVGGEGKTTLATQLALSLARAGRRTALVDFDLRRPAFDEVFGLPLEPGVCEWLRHQNAVADVVHPSATENLSVVTAGRWDRPTLASLSNGGAADLFMHLRKDFDFVVVDTSPILPVADARFVSQHVDSVVLSVFRDVSQAPKVQAACEILAAFGVRGVEAVVTSPNDHVFGRHRGYQSTISA